MSIMNRLFETVKIGKLELKNRIVMPAMCTNFSSNGDVSDKMISYYSARAGGGAGLIIVEIACVAANGRGVKNQLMIENDERINTLSKLAKRIKEAGAKAGIQLYHSGLRTNAILTKRQPLGPSQMDSADGIPSRELTRTEIDELIGKFCNAARRAKDAGFDLIELHCAHGYLLNQFLSPFFNKRSDEYGGDQAKRTEMVYRIVKTIKKTLGKDYPILCKIPGDEGLENGIKSEDAITIAQRLEDAGVDCICVSCGLSETVFATMPMGSPQGCFVHLSQNIKKHVNIPIIAIGRIKDPILADQIIDEGKADIIAMGRALIADAQLPRKAYERKIEEIRPCIGCIECVTQIANMLPIICTVNPSLGKEDRDFVKKQMHKKVLVAGGGPGGLEAAINCAKRGHNVVLIEKSNKLGGMMNVCCIPPKKEEIDDFKKFLVGESMRSGVKVILNKEVNSEVVKSFEPDAVIIATGSRAAKPSILGIEAINVATAVEIIEGKVKHGKNVVVIGGGEVGLEVADYLSEKEVKVTVIEQLPEIGIDVLPRIKVFLMKRLHEKGVRIILEGKAIEINDSGVIIELQGRKEKIACEQTVLATGMRANNYLIKELNQNCTNFRNIYVVGDAITSRSILEAVQEGYEVERLI